MRRLYLVPLMPTSSEVSKPLPNSGESAREDQDRELVERHRGLVFRYWQAGSDFFNRLDVAGFKLYQEGMLEDGEKALESIRQGSREGNPMYGLKESLIQRGVILVRCEDVELLQREQELISRITGKGSLEERENAILSYLAEQRGFPRRRDTYTAGRIHETLGENGGGIFFCSVYCRVLRYLSKDIQIIQVKEIARVRRYYHALRTPERRGRQLQELSEYLTAPVKDTM